MFAAIRCYCFSGHLANINSVISIPYCENGILSTSVWCPSYDIQHIMAVVELRLLTGVVCDPSWRWPWPLVCLICFKSSCREINIAITFLMCLNWPEREIEGGQKEESEWNIKIRREREGLNKREVQQGEWDGYRKWRRTKREREREIRWWKHEWKEI